MTALERAARALKDEIGKALDAKPLPFAGDTGNWSAKGDMQTLDLEACVRAVLMAVREPDREMIIAGNDEDGYYNDGTAFNAECSQHWKSMIDAILNEKDTTND